VRTAPEPAGDPLEWVEEQQHGSEYEQERQRERPIDEADVDAWFRRRAAAFCRAGIGDRLGPSRVAERAARAAAIAYIAGTV
jgi:hypothetical protein